MLEGITIMRKQNRTHTSVKYANYIFKIILYKNTDPRQQPIS